MDEPEDYFPCVSPHIEQNAKKIDEFWKGLSRDLNYKELNPRIIPIVMDIGIQVYVDSMIHLKLHTTALDRISFAKKIQVLVNQYVLDVNLGDRLNKLFEIRNICGHHSEINETDIHNILNSIDQDLDKKDDQNYGLRYNRIASKAILDLGKAYEKIVRDLINM